MRLVRSPQRGDGRRVKPGRSRWRCCFTIPVRPPQPTRYLRNERLSAGEVGRILRQVVAEAQARDVAATIAVTDRVGNVLAVYQMTGAAAQLVTIDAGRRVVDPAGLAGPTFNDILDALQDMQGLNIATAAAIAKAITGAYLSSGGNAFSTRTASQIVQENFNPGSSGLEGGPLFGVQFSQLPCSDLSVRFDSNNGGTIDPRIGPKRSPLGFSADPGGLPLYQNGTLVGGVGAIADGVYGLDRNISGRDGSLDEVIAVAGTVGFEAPKDLRADRVAVDGRSLRFSDRRPSDLRSRPSDADAVSLAAAGAFVPVTGYFNGGGPIAGTAFGFGQSGIRPDPDNLFDNDRAFVLTDAAGVNRFPPIAGSEGAIALTRRRGHDGAERSARGRSAGARPDPAAARQQCRGDDLGGRHDRRDSGGRPEPGCAGVRHRRVAAEGAQRDVLLQSERRGRPAVGAAPHAAHWQRRSGLPATMWRTSRRSSAPTSSTVRSRSPTGRSAMSPGRSFPTGRTATTTGR